MIKISQPKPIIDMSNKVVGCSDNTVQYNMISLIVLHWQQQKTNHTFNSQKTAHTSPLQVSYEVSFVSI